MTIILQQLTQYVNGFVRLFKNGVKKILQGRQRASDTSGVAGVHINIRRAVRLFVTCLIKIIYYARIKKNINLPHFKLFHETASDLFFYVHDRAKETCFIISTKYIEYVHYFLSFRLCQTSYMFSSSFLSKLGFVKKSFRYFYFNPEMSAASEIHKPILYGDTISPPVRFVMMTASYLEMELKFHEINLFRGENKSDFYSKINPLQKVPALSIGEETIRDSHAIALYLCKISPEQNLYPSDDAVAKAKVDEMMFFNAGALFPLDSAILSQYFAGNWPVSEEQIKQWNVLLDYLETILTKNQWLTGPKMMLCDICCAATVSSLRLLVPPEDRHKRVNEWLKQMQLLPFYKINTDGLDQLKYFIEKQKA